MEGFYDLADENLHCNGVISSFEKDCAHLDEKNEECCKLIAQKLGEDKNLHSAQNF